MLSISYTLSCATVFFYRQLYADFTHCQTKYYCDPSLLLLLASVSWYNSILIPKYDDPGFLYTRDNRSWYSPNRAVIMVDQNLYDTHTSFEYSRQVISFVIARIRKRIPHLNERIYHPLSFISKSVIKSGLRSALPYRAPPKRKIAKNPL